MHCDVQIAVWAVRKLKEKTELYYKRILLSYVFWTESLSWFSFPGDFFAAKLLSLALTCHVRSVFSLFWQCVTVFGACVASCTVYCHYAWGFCFIWIIGHLCAFESMFQIRLLPDSCGTVLEPFRLSLTALSIFGGSREGGGKWKV